MTIGLEGQTVPTPEDCERAQGFETGGKPDEAVLTIEEPLLQGESGSLG